MIISFKHKGLKDLWTNDEAKKLPPQQVKRIRILLQIIEELKDVPRDLAHLVTIRPYQLKGEWAGFWSLDVTGNWRIIFRFENGDAYDVHYIDPH